MSKGMVIMGKDPSGKARIPALNAEGHVLTAIAPEYLNRLIELEETALRMADNAGFRNSIYRGKNLGSSVTSAQWNAISSGTFEDMFIGDYWTIGGVTYIIAAFNYFRNTGDTALTKNHVTLVPSTYMYLEQMNDSNTTEGGYVGSAMRESGLDQAKTTIESAFGSSHLVTHRKYLCNAVSDGKASAAAWVDSSVELMNEMMVYGSVINGGATYIGIDVFGHYNVGIEKSQLPLFALRPDLIGIRTSWWLQDVVSAPNFAAVTSRGRAAFRDASASYGVRPAFSIS